MTFDSSVLTGRFQPIVLDIPEDGYHTPREEIIPRFIVMLSYRSLHS